MKSAQREGAVALSCPDGKFGTPWSHPWLHPCASFRLPEQLSLRYEHDRPDSGDQPVDEPESVPDGCGVVDRPPWSGDLRSDAGPYAGPSATSADGDLRRDEPDHVADPDVDRIAALVVARISQHQHFHLAEQAPDADQLAELRQKAPEAYELWIETTRKRNDHELWRSRKAVRQPYLLASLGQWLGLTAVLGVLLIAALAVWLGHAWVGAVLGVFDVIGLAAVFNGNQGRRREPPRGSREAS